MTHRAVEASLHYRKPVPENHGPAWAAPRVTTSLTFWVGSWGFQKAARVSLAVGAAGALVLVSSTVRAQVFPGSRMAGRVAPVSLAMLSVRSFPSARIFSSYPSSRLFWATSQG